MRKTKVNGKSTSAQENWIKTDSNAYKKKQAEKLVQKRKEYEEGKIVTKIPIFRGYILKYSEPCKN